MWIGYLVKVAKKFKGQLLFKENEFERAQMSAPFFVRSGQKLSVCAKSVDFRIA